MKDFLKNEWKLILAILAAIVAGWVLKRVSGSDTDWLSVVSGLLQIVTVVIALYSWFEIYRYQQKIKEAEVISGDNDLILVIDLTKKDGIINDVVGFIEANKTDEYLSALSKLHPIKSAQKVIINRESMRLEVYQGTNANGILYLTKNKDPKKDEYLYMPFDRVKIRSYVDDFKACMKEVKKTMSMSATTNRLHVFASVPTGLAAFVLCPFVNAKQVTWYAYDPGATDAANKYYCMGEVKE